MVLLRSGRETDPRERVAQIFVRMLTPKVTTPNLRLSSTGHDLKMLLMEKWGMAGMRCDRMLLSFAGRLLYDGDVLYDLGVRQEITIQLGGRFGADRFCDICRVPPESPASRPCCEVHGSKPN